MSQRERGRERERERERERKRSGGMGGDGIKIASGNKAAINETICASNEDTLKFILADKMISHRNLKTAMLELVKLPANNVLQRSDHLIRYLKYCSFVNLHLHSPFPLLSHPPYSPSSSLSTFLTFHLSLSLFLSLSLYIYIYIYIYG